MFSPVMVPPDWNGVLGSSVDAGGATQPGTSNINAFGAGQTIANSFTSQIASDSIAITCGGGPTDFIIDIFRYYP